MNGADTIWIALEIMMVVSVCIDMGITAFSAIQIIGLAESFLVLAYPGWPMWSRVFIVNIPLELLCLCCTRKYSLARMLMAFHVWLKLVNFTNIDADIQFQENWVFWLTHYLNQAILLTLLASSARSFITTRSNHARERNRKAQPAGRTRRSANSTPTATHQLAFTKGLY